MRWPWSRSRVRSTRVAEWDPDQHDQMVAALAEAAAAPDTRMVVLLRQTEDGTVSMSCWSAEACARNVEGLGLLTHGLEAMRRLNADWWDGE